MGYCNDEDRRMIKCLKEERLERRRRNIEKTKEWKEKHKVRPSPLREQM